MKFPNDYVNNIIQGDCLETLKKIPDNSINSCVTSPPYWGLRDYGHKDQMGNENTPDEYVNKMVILFREVKRVLKHNGTLWLNLGDSYAGNCSQTNDGRAAFASKRDRIVNRGKNKDTAKWSYSKCNAQGDIKNKDLVGIPWMVAFALRADGWYLRQDIIWHKPNPMPESVTDRCTKCHEYIFLLSKSSSYYYNADAILEPLNYPERLARRYADPCSSKKIGCGASKINENTIGKSFDKILERNGRNKRSVWTITTKPFLSAHFATFPEDLILPCILASTPPQGIVLDPFMGAGTTALVSKKNGCNYIGCELNQEYINIANKRLSQEYLYT